jgi:hypothetical protein
MTHYHHRFSGERHRGTIFPYPDFDAEADAQILVRAVTGKEHDKATSIINILCHRSLRQRLEIKTIYKSLFGKDLITEMKSALSGKFEEVVFALLTDSVEYNAYCLHTALTGLTTTEKTLTEIICTRSNAEIHQLKIVYEREYKKDLEKEVSSQTSGFYRRVLVACLQGNRPELAFSDIDRVINEGYDSMVDRTLAIQEAQELINAGIKKWGTDESVFIRIFLSTNPCQLRATLEQYFQLTGKTIFTTIDEEMSGDLRDAMKALVLSQISQATFYANILYDAMKGLGTRDQTLIRVVVTRSEIDLEEIKAEFQKAYGKTLYNFIEDDTSGDYRKALLTIVG